MTRGAAGEEGQIGNARGGREPGDGKGPATVLEHRCKMGKMARDEPGFSNIGTEPVHQQQEAAGHASSVKVSAPMTVFGPA
jgi:hypothetical protein